MSLLLILAATLGGVLGAWLALNAAVLLSIIFLCRRSRP